MENPVVNLEELESQESNFVFQQSIVRAQIRIKEERAEPFDIVIGNLYMAVHDLFGLDMEELNIDMDPQPIYLSLFPLLDLNQLLILKEKIQMCVKLDLKPLHQEYWTNLLTICEYEIDSKQKHSTSNPIQNELNDMFQEKSLQELLKLELQIRSKLNSKMTLDVEYWDSALKCLIVWKAKRKFDSVYSELLNKKRPFKRSNKEDKIPLRYGFSLYKAPIVDIKQVKEEMRESLIEYPVYHPSMSPSLVNNLPKEDKGCEIMTEDEYQSTSKQSRCEKSALYRKNLEKLVQIKSISESISADELQNVSDKVIYFIIP